jgi:gliding motility-associated-like protein
MVILSNLNQGFNPTPMIPAFCRYVLSFLGLILVSQSFGQLLPNSAPIILSQKYLETESGRPLTIQFTDLVVIDLDDPYPQGFTMTLYEGRDYTVSGMTVTPDDDFEGILRVTVTVYDGDAESRPFSLRITVVEPENIPPVITGQVPLSIEENTSITLTLTHLQVTDPDNDYPDDFTLDVFSGDNYRRDGQRITPDHDFTGTLYVEVRVHDGDDYSNRFVVRIEVIPENIPPTITGQSTISIEENTSFTLTLDHLTVEDPDDNYPEKFTLKVSPGTNYSLKGTTITPAKDYKGDLTVNVRVNDGIDDSNVFPLKITVYPANIAPVITGQVALTMVENTSLILSLNHLKVTDPDNDYPEDFTLTVHPGANYQVSVTRITPTKDFSGTIYPEVTVNDGKANSNRFKLQVKVTPANRPPVITGQQPLAFSEDGSLELLLTHLIVSDPDNDYPEDFTLQILPGSGYTVKGNTISAPPDFNGQIKVAVTVNDGKLTSAPYDLTINVTPVNDPPSVTLESTRMSFFVGKQPSLISKTIEVTDPDKDPITVAEVAFDAMTYRAGTDILQYDKTESPGISGVFDQGQGILFLIGNAPASEYTKALRNVSYNFVVGENEVTVDSLKLLRIKVNDGLLDSKPAVREIELVRGIKLNIPQWFTPNGDLSNDTWKIHSLNSSDEYPDALIRVYTMRGTLVFEGKGLDSEWDGRHKGEYLPTDTYYFTINLNLPYTSASYKGTVTILR